MPQLLCQDAEQSWVARADYCGNGILAVAGSVFEGGRWIGVLHRVSATDVITVDLPAPPGSNSAALGLDCDMGQIAVGGWVTDHQNRERPVVWENSGQGWMTFPINLPNGSQGQVNDVLRLESGLAVCGDVIRGGRMLGFTGTLGGANPAGSVNLLPPLDGHANSSAESLVRSTDSGATFGRSMNPGGEPVATGWIGSSPFASQQILREPDSVAEVRGALPADPNFGQLYGQIVATSGGQPQACVFPATNTHVPDRKSQPANRSGLG